MSYPTIKISRNATGILFFFFFSSRRRHTRWTGDWSRRVLFRSAGMGVPAGTSIADAIAEISKALPKLPAAKKKLLLSAFLPRDPDGAIVTDRKGRPEPDPELRRSEERRVGKDGKSRRSRPHGRK